MKNVMFLVFCAGSFAFSTLLAAETFSGVVVLNEPGMPNADSAVPSQGQMESLLPGASFVALTQLQAQLNASATRLLVLPNGSAFPEQAWPDIYAFLQRGGNLLVLGGRPFTRSAYHDASGWKLRDYSVRFTRPLMIDQYQTTPGSEGLDFEANPDLPVSLPRFSWTRAFSPVIRLSAIDLYKRGGAAGAIDARLDTLAWGVKDGRKMAAPAIVIDHLRNGFDSGRWIFLEAELTPDFYSNGQAPAIIQSLARKAMRGSQEFTVRANLPLYLPGEPIELEVNWHSTEEFTAPLSLKVTVSAEQELFKFVCNHRDIPVRGAAHLGCAKHQGPPCHRCGIAPGKHSSGPLPFRILDQRRGLPSIRVTSDCQSGLPRTGWQSCRGSWNDLHVE